MVLVVGTILAVAAVGAVAATSIENGPKKKVNEMNKHITLEHVVNNTINNRVSAHASTSIDANASQTFEVKGGVTMSSIGNCKINAGNVLQDISVTSSISALASSDVRNQIAQDLTDKLTASTDNTAKQTDEGAINSIFGSGSDTNLVNVDETTKNTINTKINRFLDSAVQSMIDTSEDSVVKINGNFGLTCDGSMNPSEKDDTLNSKKFDFYKEGVIGNLVKQMQKDNQHYFVPNCSENDDCDTTTEGSYSFKKGNDITKDDLMKMYIMMDKLSPSGDNSNIKAYNITQKTVIKSVASAVAKQIAQDQLKTSVTSQVVDTSVNKVKQDANGKLSPFLFGGSSLVSCVLIIVLGLVAHYVIPMLTGSSQNQVGGNIIKNIKMSNAMFIKLVIVLALVYISLYG